ncbi:MAG TPA: hypothetical protein PKC20_04905, partial [Burkholderiaceae bacterium]|nr:hypothetical protein [Burkholderiaceae bacterium]
MIGIKAGAAPGGASRRPRAAGVRAAAVGGPCAQEPAFHLEQVGGVGLGPAARLTDHEDGERARRTGGRDPR